MHVDIAARRVKAARTRPQRSATGLFIGMVVFVAVAVIVAVVGVQAIRAALAGSGTAHRIATAGGDGPFAVGQPVRANGAVFEVTGVDQLGGPTAKDLANVNHGIANEVTPDQVQVQITAHIANDSTHSVPFSAKQILLRVGSANGIGAMSSTIPDGRIPASASVEGNLGFVAPRRGAMLWLQLASSPKPILVTLGRADSGPPSGENHHH